MSLKKKCSPFIVAVEGNIGSGKSTMLKFFQSKDVIIDPEPVDSWRNVAGENLLNNMYKDPPRCSFTFQSYVQLTRLKLLEEHGNEKVKIIERSIQSNNFVFLETAKKRKTLSDVELEVLGSYHSWIQNHTISKHLDLIVYLRTLPEVAYCRLQKRARAEERTVPLDYLQDLHDAYEDWLMKKRHGFPPAPVLVIDANQNIESVEKLLSQNRDAILGRHRPLRT
ncbi:deoxynucleoside kinase [Lepeophtheirus salmonis]|uniref:Deoxynucleoside kinase n=2 Tax=Lepeophtheirus salmonis TaxID=72036 RepID=D3PI20_LEPSM|nr:deoxynucleoside kinase-like [Lepeophtheirus salmonis]ADD38206.1 Deoxynucleoside kinase [Lepeophtheirus salmonis]